MSHSQFDPASISKIKQTLAKRLTQLDEASNIQIKEVIVRPLTPTTGEYQFSLIPQTTAQETDESLFKRILATIKAITEFGETIHTERNFRELNNEEITQLLKMKYLLQEEFELELPLKALKANCQKNFTCVTTSEFFFYPSDTYGPLPQHFFLLLVEEIESIAKKLPENLQFLFATFPVTDADNNVSNVAISVTCGIQPKIDIFSKCFVWFEDPLYTNTKNIYPLIAYNNQHIAFKVKTIKNFIKEDLKKDNPDYAMHARMLVFLIQLAGSHKINPLNFATNYSQDLLKSYTKLGIAKVAFLGSLKKLYKKTSQNNAILDFDSFQKEVKKYLQALKESENFLRYTLFESLCNGLKITVGHHSQQTNTNYNSLISHKVGGSLFNRNTEICADHHWHLAQIQQAQLIRSGEKTACELLPTHASQMVTSNTTKLSTSSAICSDESISHADCSENHAGKLIQSYDTELPFGGKTRIEIYHSQPVKSLHSSTALRINEINLLTLDLQACRLYLAQHPTHKKDVEKHMLAIIHTYVETKLTKLLIQNRNTEIINFINDFLENLNSLTVTSAEPEKSLDFFNSHIDSLSTKNDDWKEVIAALNVGQSLVEHMCFSSQLIVEEKTFYEKLQANSLWNKPSPRSFNNVMGVDEPASANEYRV